ncbi:PQQ-binding-like beta-propeller repeat protein [Novosphingobium sp. ERN07]|nr:PQQ-binding-like beta-propeller repeat protein [Novosphingobium sp. ERN07]
MPSLAARTALVACAAGLALVPLIAWAQPSTPPPAPAGPRAYTPVTDDMLRSPPPGEWIAWRRTQDNQGSSPLTRINRSTVGRLELAWAWPMADDGIQETAPLMHDGLLFLQTNSSVVQALDARTGDLVWEYRPTLPKVPVEQAYRRYQGRRQKNSIALYMDTVVLTTADARIVVLDARTGAVLREAQVFDPELGYGYTVGPQIVNGKIISAISGCSIAETAGGCFITAHDFTTLKEVWRVNTLDDPENPAQSASWGPVPPQNRWGGTPWTTGSYDPRTNLVFWGTGGPGPYAELVRGSGAGDVLYTNSTLAIDASTGKIRWYYQHLPRDNWDLDSPFERILVDDRSGGEVRHLLITVAGKNGIFFALDRDTGRYLWSQETVFQNVVTGIDPDGKVHVNTDLIPKRLGEEMLACASVSGGKLWQAASYSPLSKSLFVPLTESCSSVTPIQAEFAAGSMVGSVKMGPRKLPPGSEDAGLVQAIPIGAERPPSGGWEARQRTSLTSSLLATDGGLVFGGDAGRYVKAWDQKSGKIVWQARLNAPVGGSPMTYELDGEQFLVVPTGYSAAAATISSAFPEVPLPSGTGNSIFVFKLKKK